jgi:predicted GIY-YIG superfamily endonuclease
MLRCRDGALYVGETNDLDLRVTRHNQGRPSVFTARRLPVTLVFAEPHDTQAAALLLERQLKRWTRAKKEALIAGDLVVLNRL